MHNKCCAADMNKGNPSDIEAPFLDLDFSITNDIASTKRDDYNFEIVNFPFLDVDVPRSPFYGVYILQLIRFFQEYVLMLMTIETHF